MAYDTSRNLTVLFGGQDGNNTVFNDDWEWDGTNWTRQWIASPRARYLHAMAYDTVNHHVVMFGGAAPQAPTVLQDTMAYRADVVPGDLDGDCAVTMYDVDPFVSLLLGQGMSPSLLARADLNQDLRVDGDDIKPFVAALLP